MTYHSTVPLVSSDTLWFYSGPVQTATSLAHRQNFLGKYTQGTGFQLKALKESRDVTLGRIKGPDLRFQPYALRGDNGSRVTEEALLRGEVDVIYARGAAAIRLQQTHDLDVVLDINALDDPKLRINNGTPRLITVHRHLLDDHPELVTLYLKALRTAGQWASEHPDEVVQALAEDTDSTPENVRRGYGPRLEHIFDINLNTARVAALQDQVDFLHRFGLIETRFDVENWIDTSPLVHSSLSRDH